MYYEQIYSALKNRENLYFHIFLRRPVQSKRALETENILKYKYYFFRSPYNRNFEDFKLCRGIYMYYVFSAAPIGTSAISDYCWRPYELIAATTEMDAQILLTKASDIQVSSFFN